MGMYRNRSRKLRKGLYVLLAGGYYLYVLSMVALLTVALAHAAVARWELALGLGAPAILMFAGFALGLRPALRRRRARGAGLLARFSISDRSRRAAARASRTSIREVRDGRAALIVGRVRLAGASIEAPFSGRRVCYYAAGCSRQDADNPYLEYAPWPIGEEGACEFLIEDRSGRALIRVDSHASFELVTTSWVGNVPEERMRAFLDKLGHDSDDHERWKPREHVLEDGAVVAVYGVGEWEPDPAPDPRQPGVGYREAPRRLVMRAPKRLHLYVSERPMELEPMVCSR